MTAATLSSEQELRNALQRRQERCEREGSVFEREAAVGTSDISFKDHTANQFTPRETREQQLAAGLGKVLDPGASAPIAEDESNSESESVSDSEEDDEIEELRRCLELEREQAKAMEKRAAEAEEIAVWLKEELDRSSDRPHQAGEEDAGHDNSVDHTRVVRREMPRQDPEEIRKVLALREELHKLQTHAARKQEEVMDFTERNQEISEELEHEKQRVLELQREESAKKRELDEVTGDADNVQLKGELKQMRDEAKRLKEKIDSSRGGEQSLKEEIAHLRSGKSRSMNCNPEEMERLSMTVGGQLVTVERELAAKTKEVSDLADPFLRQMHSLLEAARRACQRLDSASPGGPRKAPKLFDPRSRDIKGALRGMRELLHYMVEVLSRDRRGDAGEHSDGSDSSQPSVAPSRTIPEEDEPFRQSARQGSSNWAGPQSGRKGKGSARSKPKEDDRSSGWSKRWTCMLAE